MVLDIFNIKLYRIIHIDNLHHILKNGIYSSNSSKLDPDFKPIGNHDIISKRENKVVNVPPFGCLGDYIPFYFGKRSPMLYCIAHGYETVKIGQEDIVYLVTTTGRVVKHELCFIFTPGNARRDTSTYYTELEDIKKLDWNAINNRWWSDDESGIERKDKKQSEFLVRGYVPVSCLEEIVIYNDKAGNIVRQLLAIESLDDQIEVMIGMEDYYYDNV